jgi:hypothetical protein
MSKTKIVVNKTKNREKLLRQRKEEKRQAKYKSYEDYDQDTYLQDDED